MASKDHHAPVRIGRNVFVVRDTCNVYVVRTTDGCAITFDFGSGLVLDALEAMGVTRLTHVFVTHAHRDQVEGLASLPPSVTVVVPPVEIEQIVAAEEHWARQSPLNDYVLREQRFTPLSSYRGRVEPAREYRDHIVSGLTVRTLPTPGHTVGSVSYRVETDGRTHVFTGDLIAAPGKVHSLAALQWNYVGVEGAESALLSAAEVLRAEPDVLLPSHGAPMRDPVNALSLLARNLQDYVDLHQYHPKPQVDRRPIAQWAAHPYRVVSPHVLMNTASHGRSYILLSDSGHALVFDFGYDLTPGMAAGGDRAARRPSLGSLATLRRDFGVKQVEVAAPTHYHDDHVAGLNLLRDVEGTQIWCPARFADVLAAPGTFDLPCQWYEPIPADRILPSGETFMWREHRIRVHDLPGHTYYAVAYELDVDGVRYLITGDQQDGLGTAASPDDLNYQYRNLFRADDYRRSADLFARVRPDVMLSGHWDPAPIDDDYIAMIRQQGESLVEIHERLLPDFDPGRALTGFHARIVPYLPHLDEDGRTVMEVTVDNPASTPTPARVRLVSPAAIEVSPQAHEIVIGARGSATCRFEVRVPGPVTMATPVAAEIVLGDDLLGQHAEALFLPSRTTNPHETPEEES